VLLTVERLTAVERGAADRLGLREAPLILEEQGVAMERVRQDPDPRWIGALREIDGALEQGLDAARGAAPPVELG
jgi:hypothetical protein